MFLTEGHNDESSVNLGNHHDSKNKRLKNSYLLKHLTGRMVHSCSPRYRNTE
jgi:hypothetical protein